MTPIRLTDRRVIRRTHIHNADIVIAARRRPRHLVAFMMLRGMPIVSRGEHTAPMLDERLASTLNRVGFRLNDERRAVLEVLTGTTRALDAEQVFIAIQANGGGVARSTTHRTLRLLLDLEVVEVAARRRGRRTFRLRSGAPSVHMVRADTGDMHEVADPALMEALVVALARRGYRLQGGVELRVMPLPMNGPAG